MTVQPDLWVANMVAQHGMRPTGSESPIRYDAVERCLEAVAGQASRLGASVHMPRIGCGLAGGKWELIEPIIIRTLVRTLDRDHRVRLRVTSWRLRGRWSVSA